MRLKSALRRGVAAAVIAGIVVSSGIPAYAAPWNIADGDITVKAGDTEGTNWVTQGKKENVEDTDTVITGKSEEHTVTIDTSKGKVDVTFDDLKIDVSGKKEGDGSSDGSTRESNAAVTVQGDHDATIELDGKNELKSGSYHAGLEKNDEMSEDGETISGKLTIKDDNDTKGSLTAEGGDGGGAGIGGKHESGAGNIEITGGTIKAVGGEGAAGIGGGVYGIGHDIEISGGKVSATGGSYSGHEGDTRTGAAGIGDGAGTEGPEIDPDAPPNPNHIIICGDAEVTAKAGRSQMLDAKAPAIGGSYGEVPTENLSDDEHKVTGGRLTRLNADGTVMEGMGYDYTSTPKPQPDDDEDDDDDDVPPPVQENAPEPLPGGMVVGGFFSSRVTIQRLDPALAIDSAADARADLTPGGVVLIESAAPRSTVTTDISSLREDGVEDIFFRYEDTMTHYSVEKMADAAGEDADVELKQNREDISLRLDGETRDDLSERYQKWVPVQTPEPQERLILTHEGVEQKTSEELRREREEARRELDESLRQERIFQIEKRDDLPSLDWWLEPAREETPGMLDESLKQLASRFEDIAPEEDKKPLLVLVEPSGTERKKYTDPLESDLRRYTDLSDDWDDQPDTQGEIKIWIPEDLGQPKEISILKESLSRIDGIA